MNFRPGTVSKILWHFTGGPRWNAVTNRQENQLKPAVLGYEALKSILAEMELRLGSYHEVVKVVIPRSRKYNPDSKKFETVFNRLVEVKSCPVCCLADIPLQHISYHANRYGKIAIGFHRESVVRSGFNPVMYTLENTDLLNSIYTSYSALDGLDIADAQSELQEIDEEIRRIFDEREIDEEVDIWSAESALDYISSAKDDVDEGFENILAYLKTFNENEFDSIYCEREWRSTNKFSFSLNDIAIIVLPKNSEGFDFYSDFLNSTNLPRRITVAAWEDLIEH